MLGPGTVVGGANTDIVGMAKGAFTEHDSNPGHVRVSAGGVGRNIAENLARLGASVGLVTVFGGDRGSTSLRIGCEQAGIDLSRSTILEDASGPRYLAVMDASGDLEAAVSDMCALEKLTPEAINEIAPAIEDAALLVLDTNPSVATLERIAELADGKPIILDPVSVAKAPRARNILRKLYALKTNVAEAGVLAGMEVHSRGDAETAADKLIGLGVSRVFLTMGPEGVYCASADEHSWLPSPTTDVVNATGAGDAFTAGVAWGALSGMGVRESGLFASAMAAITLSSDETVSDAMSLEIIEKRAKEMFS